MERDDSIGPLRVSRQEWGDCSCVIAGLETARARHLEALAGELGYWVRALGADAPALLVLNVARRCGSVACIEVGSDLTVAGWLARRWVDSCFEAEMILARQSWTRPTQVTRRWWMNDDDLEDDWLVNTWSGPEIDRVCGVQIAAGLVFGLDARSPQDVHASVFTKRAFDALQSESEGADVWDLEPVRPPEGWCDAPPVAQPDRLATPSLGARISARAPTDRSR